jgi:hypothetical protein
LAQSQFVGALSADTAYCVQKSVTLSTVLTASRMRGLSTSLQIAEIM